MCCLLQAEGYGSDAFWVCCASRLANLVWRVPLSIFLTGEDFKVRPFHDLSLTGLRSSRRYIPVLQNAMLTRLRSKQVLPASRLTLLCVFGGKAIVATFDGYLTLPRVQSPG